MGGRITVESVVRCSWNGWPDDRGIRRVWVAGLLSLVLMPVAFSFLWLRIAHRHNDKALIWSYIVTLAAQIGLSGLGLSAYVQ